MSLETQLLVLRIAHTAVFVVETAAILYMIWRGLRGPVDLWSLLSVLLTAGTGVALLLNDGDCIFHTWAVALTGNPRESDILLPRRAAELILPVSLPFAALGYGLLARQWLIARRHAG